MSGFGYGGGNTPSSVEKAQLMDQVKGQIALANAQELVQVNIYYIYIYIYNI